LGGVLGVKRVGVFVRDDGGETKRGLIAREASDGAEVCSKRKRDSSPSCGWVRNDGQEGCGGRKCVGVFVRDDGGETKRGSSCGERAMGRRSVPRGREIPHPAAAGFGMTGKRGCGGRKCVGVFVRDEGGETKRGSHRTGSARWGRGLFEEEERFLTQLRLGSE
jgi:hypothetical protein